MLEQRIPTRLPDESLRAGLENAPADIIINTVLGHYNVSLNDLKSKNRKLSKIIVQHMLHYLLSVNRKRSYSEIGLLLLKNHSTIINSRRKMEDWTETSRELKLTVIKIYQSIIKNAMKPQIQLIGQVTNLNPVDAKINFKEAQNYLEARNWDVWNPMEHVPADTSQPEAMRICIANLISHRVTAVGVLKNWVKSKGAKVEFMVANALELKVIEL